ncbi:eukaryotic translation initiation factor 3 subunit A-like [Styela clava]
MPEYFQRPENALKRAQEFLEVGKLKPALDVLSDVLRSKKHRTWQKIHEQIIRQYLNLCVDLRKSQAAKEGLYQYKIICQQVNINSLENAVKNYLKLAEEKTEEAKDKSTETALQMVEDLDMIDSPEGVLLSAVTGEKTHDRTNRLMLTPWVKFLWESYRQCLDLLRNNNRVEKLYQDIALNAFEFCLKYDRRTEFRKLCDNLRNHVKLSEQRHQTAVSINLTNVESQLLHLGTRIAQLDSAIKIELWQEAFKAVEDIHYLMSLSKKPPKPQVLVNFHSKLSLVFWKAGNMLFHASSRHHLFRLTKEMKKNPTKDDLSRMASLMLVSTLAIPITEQKHGIGKMLDMESALIDKHLKLAKLLGLSRPPTRSSLIEDLKKHNILQYTPKQLRDLFQWLEVDFHPLRLSARVGQSLQWIREQTREPELAQYITALEGNVVSRVLQQVANVYQTIELSHLLSLLPFCSAFQLERAIIDASRNGQIQVRIDHSKGAIRFGTDLNASPLYVEDEFFEPQRLQPLPSEKISQQFNEMAQSLHVAYRKLQPQAEVDKMLQRKNEILNLYTKTWRKDQQNILQRRQVIEMRKEQLEEFSREREKQEQKAAKEQEEAVKAAEQERLTKEMREREEMRRREEKEDEERRVAQDRLEMIRKSELGAKMLKDIDVDTFTKIDPDELMKRQMETMEREKKDMQDRLKAQEKKVDYFERAKRLEEIPLMKEKYEKKRETDAILWEELEAERIERTKVEQIITNQTKERLSRMKEDRNIYLQSLRESRRAIFDKKHSEFEKMLFEVREERLAERKQERKEQRRQKWLKDKAEYEQRILDEQLKREREEKERAEREKQEEETRAYEEKMQALKIAEEKRLQREREIEAKIAAQQNPNAYRPRGERDGPPARRDDDRGAWRGPGGGGSRFKDDAPDDNPWRRDGPPAEKQAWRPSRRDGPPRDFDFPSRIRTDGPRDRGWEDRGPPKRRDDDQPSDWRRRRSPSPRRPRSPDRYQQRRMSPPGGRSPPPRRGSPMGRQSSPPGRGSPLGRRRSPMGERSPPRNAWRRDRSPPPLTKRGPPEDGPWKRGGPPPRDDEWRRDRGPPRGDGDYPSRDRINDTRGPLDDRKWGPPRRDDRDRSPPPRQDRFPPKREDDGWTTVRN